MTKQLVGIGTAANDASGDTLRVGATKINDNFNEIYTGFGDGTTLNTTISLGGLTLSLGDTDATPAFDLSDATNYPTSSLIGTISNAQLAGSIPNSKLATPNILFRGDAATAITQSLGGTLQIAGGVGVTTAVSGNTVTITNSGYGSSNFTVDLSNKTTTDLAEGTNLYYTDARADARAQLKVDALIDSSPGALDTLNELAQAIGDDANFSTTITNSIATKLATSDFNSTFDPRFNTQLATKDTDDLSEGTTNLYHTTARADARVDAGFTAKSTTNLSEGTNLYYTDSRADARITAAIIDEDNMVTDSDTRIPSQQSVKAYVDSQILTKDNSDEIAEGSSNLYHTEARARSSISVSGDLSYDSSTGVVSFSQGNTDSITEGSTNLFYTDARARGSISASGSLAYNSTTGAIAYTQGNSDTVPQGSTNFYYTDAKVITAVTSSDLDMGSNNITTTGELRYSNMFATAGDLPNATTYHGMFAHVHATGKAYFAHASNWIGLLDTTTSTTANLPEGSNLYYTDARVDTHLNTSGAASGNILSWNGTDYAWVADQTGGGGGTAITVQDEGTNLSTAASVINFVGAGVVASGQGTTKTITVAGGGSAITVQEEGSDLNTAAETFNFVGAGVTASGTGTVKTITVPGGGAAITVQEEGSSLSTAAETLNFVGAGVTASGTGTTKTITIANLTDAEVRTAYENNSNTNGFTDAEKSKLGTVETNAKDDLTGSEIKALYEAQSNTNAFTDADSVKLGTVAANATADQTDAEIRAAVEAATDSNVFTDADHTKLNAIEAGADITDTSNVVNALSAGTNISISAGGQISAAQIAITDVFTVGSESTQLAISTSQGDVIVRTDQNKTYIHNGGSAGTMADFTLLLTPTGGVTSVVGSTGVVSATQIKTAYEALNDTNEFTDAEKSKLGTVEQAATADQTDAEIRAAVEAATDSNVFTDADHTKLNAIEASATADQTDAEIRAAVEAASDSNVFTDADHNKLVAIEASATADQTDAEIRTAVEAATDSNVFTDADHTKLNAIEASADVTDTTNVVAALTAGSNITIAADGTIASSGGGGGSAITIQEEGSSLATAASTINFVGGGVTASGTGTTKTITVSGSAGAELASGAIVGTNLVLTKSDSTTVSIDASTLINPVGLVSGSNQWYISYGTNADDPVNVSTTTNAVASQGPYYWGEELVRGSEYNFNMTTDRQWRMGIWDGAQAAQTIQNQIVVTNWNTVFMFKDGTTTFADSTNTEVSDYNSGSEYSVANNAPLSLRFLSDGHLELVDKTGGAENTIGRTITPLSVNSFKVQFGAWSSATFPNGTITNTNFDWEVAHDLDLSEDGVKNGVENHTVIKSGISINPGEQININLSLDARGDYFGTNYSGNFTGVSNAEELLVNVFRYQTNESIIGSDYNFNTSSSYYFVAGGGANIHSWRNNGVNNPVGMISLRYYTDNSIQIWSEVENELIATAQANGSGAPIHLFHGIRNDGGTGRTYAQIPTITKSTIAVGTGGAGVGMTTDLTIKTADFSIVAAANYTAYLVSTASNVVTATLPSSPVNGQRVKLIDIGGNAATNNITIARGGNNIQGDVNDLVLSTNRITAELLFITGSGWIKSDNT